MGTKDSDEDPTEREKRIAELKRQAEELTGGKMVEGEMEETPSEVAEQFWEQVVAYEKAPWTTNFKQLEESGMQLPAPETLDDEQLTSKLGELIQRLALLRIFLDETDHLSDRELYTELWSDMLREEVKAAPLDEYSACHMSPLGGCSEEDIQLQMKYYADEEWRRHWQEDFPDFPMPDHEDPPYDRDRFLPQPDYGSASEQGPN
jgi:flagellar biosynthesis GTPase FlhF